MSTNQFLEHIVVVLIGIAGVMLSLDFTYDHIKHSQLATDIISTMPAWYIEAERVNSNPANHHIGMEQYVDEQDNNVPVENNTGKILRPRTFPCHEQEGTAPCYNFYQYSK